jgi:hypothetical protein
MVWNFTSWGVCVRLMWMTCFRKSSRSSCWPASDIPDFLCIFKPRTKRVMQNPELFVTLYGLFTMHGKREKEQNWPCIFMVCLVSLECFIHLSPTLHVFFFHLSHSPSLAHPTPTPPTHTYPQREKDEDRPRPLRTGYFSKYLLGLIFFPKSFR